MSQDVYTHKLSLAQSIVDEHNNHLVEDQRLDWKQIEQKIKSFGGTSDETLREMTWEDLQDAGIPRVLSRRIANQVFRKDHKPKAVNEETANSMSFTELFAAYDPSGESNPTITKRLRDEAEGKACVVFDKNGNVDVDESVELLRQLKEGFPEKKTLGIREVMRIGETPNRFFDENFLFPGEPLRGNRCDHTNRDVSSIPLEARQIIYIAINETGELVCKNVDDAHRILDMLDCDDAVDKAQARYTRAACELQRLQQLNRAPALKLEKGKSRRKSNDPFYGASK